MLAPPLFVFIIMKLGIIAYLPPSRIGNTYEFVSNLKDYPPENRVYFYSDQFWTGLGVDVTLIETPSIHHDPFRKNGPPNLGVINAIFLRGLQIAIRNELTHFIFIESDCRFGCVGWDKSMFDEMFSGGDVAVVGGTIACQNPSLGTNEFIVLWNEFKKSVNCQHYNWPAITYEKNGCQCSPFVNGALAVYNTNEVKGLIGRCNIGDLCRKIPAYDLHIGRLLTERHGDVGAFKRLKHLHCSWSLYFGRQGTLCDVLQTRLLNGQSVAIHPIKNRWKPNKGVVQTPNVINIRRYGSFGDVVMSTVVASKLKEHGYRVGFVTAKGIDRILYKHPHIDKIIPVDSYDNKAEYVHAGLDHSIEISPKRKTHSAQYIFLETAYLKLKQYGISLDDYSNIAPVLAVTDEEKHDAINMLHNVARPWVMVIPKSNYWPSRTVNSKTWGGLVGLVNGTLIWTGTDPAPEGYVDFKIRDMRKMMAHVSVADLVISVDTGPMHFASAFNKPIVAIKQCVDPILRISEKRDFVSVGASVDCLGCDKMKCPINEGSPPCQQVDPMVIADAANAKLDAYIGHSVSAIIPVYKPDGARLNRCLNHILPEVDEVVIGVDGGCSLPEIVKHPKIKVVFGPLERRGYGKTCNMAARNSTGHWLLMLNDDVFVDSGAVSKMIIPADEKTGIVGAHLRYPNGITQHGGGVRVENNGWVGYKHIDYQKNAKTIKNRSELEFVCFAMAAVRRTSFYEATGFDEKYDCYHEDSDICLSIRMNGWRVFYEPNATAIHAEAQTTRKIGNQLASESYKIFDRKWRWYFETNKNNSGLGVFA